MCLHTYRGIHAHAHTYLWPCFYTAFSRKVPPHVLVCERLSSLHRQTLNRGGRERATTRRRPRRRSGTRAARPQRAAPLPQQQGARLRLVRAPDVTHRPMSLRGFASRPGAARGGREVLLRARPGDRPGRAGGARAAGGSGRGWVWPRVSPRFEAASSPARWGRSWSCSSKFLLTQPLSSPRVLTGSQPVSCL